jgi:poly(hydroxyalkanoate) granule-associated protein
MMETDNMARQWRTLRDDLSEAGRDVWLASLGAVALIEKESRNAFSMLVEKGKTFETQERSVVDRMFQQAADQVRGLGKRMESGLQDTSKMVLQRFGVPSHAEINALITRVEQLTAKVEAISRKEAVDDQEG